MSTSPHAAIDALCRLLDELPKSRRADAIHRACRGVGRAPEPTGLEPESTRKIRQLYWELTTKDLCQRLTELVDEIGIDEKLLILGVVSFLDRHFASHATPEYAQRRQQSHMTAIAGLERELKLPAEQRHHPISDAEIQDLIEKTRVLSELCESRRQQAEATLKSLREMAGKVFTAQFWHDFSSEQLRRLEE